MFMDDTARKESSPVTLEVFLQVFYPQSQLLGLTTQIFTLASCVLKKREKNGQFIFISNGTIFM